MQPIKAITLSLGELDKVVVSTYQLGLIINNLYLGKSYRGEKVNLKKDFAERADVYYYLNQLLSDGVLSPYKELSGIYTLLGRADASPEDVVCSVDPFCYISHLSAMAYHGLTDRIPVKLNISSPSGGEWRVFAINQMKKDLGAYFDLYNVNGMPKLVRTKIKKIKKQEVYIFNSKHLGAYKNVKGRAMRVSTIGRTFLEMLRNPELCGGIHHVLDVFEEYGKKYLRLITDDIDRNGSPIDKVRAGYILDEKLGIQNEVIENWSSFAQRGGSRRLDPKAEYMPFWSDKWMISLNVPGVNNEY